MPYKLENILLMLCYLVLMLLWVGIAAVIYGKITQTHKPFAYGGAQRKLLWSGLFVASTLAFDSGYWLVATGGRCGILFNRPDIILQLPLMNIVEKLPLIAAGVIFFRMFSSMSRLTEEETDRKYFSKFVDRTFDAISVLDTEGKVLYWNRAAENLYSWNAREVVGRHITEFMVPPEKKQEIAEVLELVRRNRCAKNLERTQRLTANGELIEVNINTAPIMDIDFHGYLSIMRAAPPRNSFVDNPFFKNIGSPTRITGKIFVAMPYDEKEYSSKVWHELIEPLGDSLDIRFFRADKQLGTARIVDRVWEDIATSELVLADITGSNPNVFYEIGLAHALGIQTVHIMRQGVSIPFNLQHLNILQYKIDDLKSFGNILEQAISERISRKKRENRK